MLQADWEVELVCRCLFFLIRVHHNQLVGMATLLPLVADLRSHVSTTISQYKVFVNVLTISVLVMDLALISHTISFTHTPTQRMF